MATLNLSTNGPSITNSYQKIVNSPPPSGPQASSPTYGQWAVYSVQAPLVSAFQNDSGKESVLKVQTTGEGELVDLVEEFSDGRIQFGFVKVKDPNTTLPKSVLIAWCGQGVPERTKGYFTSHLAAVSKLLHGYHVQVTARSDADLAPENIVQKVADSSGSKYSGGGSVPSASAGGPPPIASKPVFQPTRVGGGVGGFNPLGSRARVGGQNQPTDEDGWGADAPPISRSQLEKVAPAYQPTKVNIGDLTSKPQEPSRFNAPSASSNGGGDVVRGGYQPIGKVDIAEIRRQAKESGSTQDDRPTIVKGAYEPVGKVDIAAIKARAAGPGGASPPTGLSPAGTGTSARSDEQQEAPRSLADRSAAFQQSERLTSLPKPKVANKFGGSSAFTGTKAPAPGGFAAKPLAAAAPVGTASKTFADEGGKTPAQIWAEKKAKQAGGVPVTSPSFGGPTSPIASQRSGEGGWKSGYTGKSWAPVQTTRTGQSATSNTSQPQDDVQAEEPSSPAGGVSSIRDRFAGAAPMGAPSARPMPEPVEPPPMDMSSKPNAGARGIPIPGLPSRPTEEHVSLPPPPATAGRAEEEEEEEEDYARPSSPIRIAQPVARSSEPEIEPASEPRQAMPTESIAAAAKAARSIPPEPQVEEHDPARGAGLTAAEETFGPGASGADHGAGEGGPRALVQYDYEKAEDNEIELREGAYVADIDMVDEDWWMGTNEQGERGLFPSNYVEVLEADAAAAPAPAAVPSPPPVAEPAAPAGPPAPAGKAGPTATAQYDYEAAEDNELSFPDGATITDVEFPDDDWWFGHYGGKSGLFPANYVQIDE